MDCTGTCGEQPLGKGAEKPAIFGNKASGSMPQYQAELHFGTGCKRLVRQRGEVQWLHELRKQLTDCRQEVFCCVCFHTDMAFCMEELERDHQQLVELQQEVLNFGENHWQGASVPLYKDAEAQLREQEVNRRQEQRLEALMQAVFSSVSMSIGDDLGKHA